MRAPNKQDRIQIPLMFAFRDAHDKRDAAGAQAVVLDGEQLVADRGALRRRGAQESTLKQDLGVDLSALVDTIALESSEDLAGLPYIRKSILNFGIQDVASITIGSAAERLIGEQLKAALLNHEPRLRAQSLVVSRNDGETDSQQRTRYRVQAEMICKPLDIPVEFLAEVDATSGKVVLARLPSPG
ncbi:MAG TPA: GPW/gp25 family protein [Devosia sp.]|nr:GPW/gp25 family protein [Devosia sp.]